MNEIKIDSADDLFRKLNELPNNYIFRGQSDASWDLESSLERVVGSEWSAASARKFEDYSLTAFQSKFHLYDRENLEPRSKLAWLALMQHYGVPTRLIDFTESPYVALYFALESYNPLSKKDLAIFTLDYSANRTSEITLEGFLTGAGVTGSPHQLRVQAAELKDWKSWQSLHEVEVVMTTHWKQKRARIAGIQGNMIGFQEPENKARAMNHLEQGGTPHWYENAYEFLDAEGEFYLNTQTETLFYKPRAGENMTTAEVVVPSVETLFDIKGESPEKPVSGLVFEGITFEYSNWTEPNRKGYTIMQSATHYGDGAENMNPDIMVPAAVTLGNAKAVEIRSCTVRHTGAHGIAAVRDVVSDCSIVGNLVRDASAGGIYLMLNHAGSSGNAITDNTLEWIGMEYSDSCGILIARTPDVRVLHNEIRDVRYTGISTGWSWNDKDSTAKNHEVGHNLIHRTMGLHDDGGGIYTLGKIDGMKFHHNYIHNITRSKYAGNYGICGIYLDNGSCHKLVRDNVIENVEAAFFSGNKPNYKNTFERNYHMCPSAKVIEKDNIVRDNVEVKKGSEWPAAAMEIMKKAGPRADYRRSKD